MGSQNCRFETLDADRAEGCIRAIAHAYTKDGGLAVLKGNIAKDGCVVKQPALMKVSGNSVELQKYSTRKKKPAKASSTAMLRQETLW